MLDVDVALVGAGFAGLCLARHLLRVRAETSIVLIDRGPVPRPASTRGVGESTSEIAAWYLAERLGLREQLEREQIVKFGLRFWLGAGRIDERIELGPMGLPVGADPSTPLPLEPHAYQLHRGRIEAALVELLGGAVGWRANRSLRDVERDDDGWRLTLDDGEPIRARWIVDAAGDGELSRAQLGEALGERRFDHPLAAAWWWVEGRVDPATWAEREHVRERVPADLRWRSTHHFVGPGYWVWLIPLADGSTSVGLVLDETHHGPASLAELRERFASFEPELAERLACLPTSPSQARRLEARAFTQPVQPGWLVSGAALAFLDPLFSSGHDLLAIVHELAVPAIVDALEGRDPSERITHANRSFAAILDHFAGIYTDNATLLAQPLTAALYLLWQQALYFAWLCPLVLGARLDDPQLARLLTPLADRVHRLGARVHELLRRWAQARAAHPGRLRLHPCIDQGRVAAVMQHFLALAPLVRAPPPAARLLAQQSAAVASLEQLALGLFERACIDLSIEPPSEPIDPYAIGLDRQRWAAEGLFSPRRAKLLDPSIRRDLDRIFAPL